MGLVGVLGSWFHDLSFIAEDLGYITPSVRKLVEDSGFPGMKILEFAFDAHGESDYLPHRCDKDSVCYMGTHDNDTVAGWLETTDEDSLDFARRYMHITQDEGWSWGLIRTGMSTASRLFVVQMQDVLELPAGCRMNTPGLSSGNWQWRMLPGSLRPELAEKTAGIHLDLQKDRCKASSPGEESGGKGGQGCGGGKGQGRNAG